MRLPPLPTMIVGSLPQPDWLIDRERLGHQFPPRIRATELWRIPTAYLREAQDDATLVALRAQEEAGLDVVTDGEIRRESYSNHFATALDGLDLDHPGTVRNRSGIDIPVPRVTGEIRRTGPVQVDDVRFLRAHTGRPIKITVPGPFTMAQQAQNDNYADDRALAMAYADVVREEIADLFAAGADIVQIDEPWLQARPEVARRYGAEAVTRAAGTPPVRYTSTCASGTPRWSPIAPRATPSWPNWPTHRLTPSPSRRRSRTWTPRPCARSGARASRSASWTSRHPTSRRRRQSPTGSAGRWTTSTWTGSCSPATAA
jgi:hypothetical protein